jgi:hypothetical protein
MPHHFETNGGIIRNGIGIGEVEYLRDSIDNGNGVIQKGNFTKGVLHDIDGIQLSYTENNIIQLRGNFINGKLEGLVEEISYTETFNESDVEDELGMGNGNDDYGRLWIKNSNSQRLLLGRRKTKQYTNGIEGAMESDNSVEFRILVRQKQFIELRYFCRFDINVV